MIATRTKLNNHLSYSYDSFFDTLRITFKYSPEFYYDEVEPNFLVRFDEETDELVGLQILKFKKIDRQIFNKYLNQFEVAEVTEIIKLITKNNPPSL